MRVPKKLGSSFAALACINLLLPFQWVQASDGAIPVVASAQGTASSSPTSRGGTVLGNAPLTRDVSLSSANELRGELVDKNGVRLANRVVVAVHADKTSFETVSDANGNFRFSRAKPGMYQIASQQSLQVCRCWAANTAPPAASQQLLLVEGDQTIRGQRPIGELLSGPILIGLIIAAAVIIPIAIHNSQKSAS